MLAQMKYDRRVASSCWVIRCDVALGPSGRSALDAEEEIRRHQQRRDADREPLVERLLLLLRFLRQADVLVDLARRHRPPERALRQAGDDPAGAGRLVLAVQVAADVDPRPALGRGRRRLRVRPANLEVADARAVERNLLELGGCGHRSSS